MSIEARLSSVPRIWVAEFSNRSRRLGITQFLINYSPETREKWCPKRSRDSQMVMVYILIGHQGSTMSCLAPLPWGSSAPILEFVLKLTRFLSQELFQNCVKMWKNKKKKTSAIDKHLVSIRFQKTGIPQKIEKWFTMISRIFTCPIFWGVLQLVLSFIDIGAPSWRFFGDAVHRSRSCHLAASVRRNPQQIPRDPWGIPLRRDSHPLSLERRKLPCQKKHRESVFKKCILPFLSIFPVSLFAVNSVQRRGLRWGDHI